MKRFVIKVFLSSIPIILVVLLCLYYNFIIKPDLTGDLGKLGKIRIGQEYDLKTHKSKYADLKVINYPEEEQTLYHFNNEKTHIFTLGDSFSQQGFDGYQNIISHDLDTLIINIKTNLINKTVYSPSAEQAAISLLNAGFFDSIPNSLLILESGERYFIDRILQLDFEKGFIPDDYTPLLNNKSLWQKDFADWFKIQTHLSDNPVKKAQLKNPMFSHEKYHSDLFFFSEDLNRRDVNQDELKIVEKNLKYLHEIFKAKNITLVYVVIPDKYDVYEDIIVDNKFGEKRLNQRIVDLTKSFPWMIYPLAELKERVRKKEQDLYYLHDSHWTYKGARILSNILIQNFIKAPKKIGHKGNPSDQ